MPTKLKPVRSYVAPSIYNRMESARARMRRISRSRFIEDAILEKLERLDSSPAARTPIMAKS